MSATPKESWEGLAPSEIEACDADRPTHFEKMRHALRNLTEEHAAPNRFGAAEVAHQAGLTPSQVRAVARSWPFVHLGRNLNSAYTRGIFTVSQGSGPTGGREYGRVQR